MQDVTLRKKVIKEEKSDVILCIKESSESLRKDYIREVHDLKKEISGIRQSMDRLTSSTKETLQAHNFHVVGNTLE